MITIEKETTIGSTTINMRLTEHGTVHVTDKCGPQRREIYVPLTLLEVFMGAYLATQQTDPWECVDDGDDWVIRDKASRIELARVVSTDASPASSAAPMLVTALNKMAAHRSLDPALRQKEQQ